MVTLEKALKTLAISLVIISMFVGGTVVYTLARELSIFVDDLYQEIL